MNDDRPVLVVDLRSDALAEDRAALDAGEPPPLPADAPLDEHEEVSLLAILHDGSDEPLLLPLPRTRDRRRLDAIARLLRFAVLHRTSIPEAAIVHGDTLERRLAFARELPAWAYDGIDPRDAKRLPAALRRVLERRAR